MHHHAIMLSRLEKMYGISGRALRWLRAYLGARTQYVMYGGKCSTPATLLYGVQQSSVLGPLPFVLYTAQLEDVDRSHNCKLSSTLMTTSCTSIAMPRMLSSLPHRWKGVSPRSVDGWRRTDSSWTDPRQNSCGSPLHIELQISTKSLSTSARWPSIQLQQHAVSEWCWTRS